ncbi:MAG: DUF1638 domain-containing protein [Methanomassiliicoccus sp.]|nr:MAG: DUF1638 domain-containing protein [Methanomassiliicoccus sp.]
MLNASDQVVDDCMGVAAGGVDPYMQILRSNHGAFFLNPMWASDWRHYFVDIMVLQNPDDLEGVRYVSQYMNYGTVTMMCTGLGNKDEFHRDVLDFSRAFSLKVEECQCSTSVVDRSYAIAKALMTAPDPKGRKGDYLKRNDRSWTSRSWWGLPQDSLRPSVSFPR